MKQPITHEQLEVLEKHALTPHRQVTMPTTQLRQLIDEIYELRDQNTVLQMKVDGSKAIVDAIVTAAREDVDTRLCAIQIPRANGPSFSLIEALLSTRGEP